MEKKLSETNTFSKSKRSQQFRILLKQEKYILSTSRTQQKNTQKDKL